MADTVKKVTKREQYNALLALAEVKANDELVAFINHEIELLDKKNSADKKPTATQIANVAIKEKIVDVMAEGTKYSITDIQKLLDEELTNQKLSALARQLVAEGKVERIEDKNKAYFKLV